MDSNYYKQYYAYERNHWWFQVRAKIIFTKVQEVIEKSKMSAPKILNIGAATGYTSEILAQLGSVKSVEYDKECYDFLVSLNRFDCVNASIAELPFGNESFDIVCAFDVVEHVEDDNQAVAEMQRVCKSNGVICITVPAFMDLWSEHDEVNHHFRRYTKSTLLAMFDRSKIIYQSYFNTILFIPVYVFRKISNLFFKRRQEENTQLKSDFEFNNRILNLIFYRIFNFETYLLQYFRSLPFGVSFFLITKK